MCVEQIIRQRVRVESGERSDYDALSAFHYRAGRPATIVRVLRAVDGHRDECIGVLVVSMPVLNGKWRRQAFGEQFHTTDKRYNAQQINAHLRTISRVVIDPRWRGVGLAQRLVRTYLESPMTELTEAVAAMGEACPFFEKAGMVRYEIEGRACDGRLIDALAFRGHDRWLLADVCRAVRVIEADALLRRELVIWTRAVGKGGRVQVGDIAAMVRAAAVYLACKPVAYAYKGSVAEGNGHNKEAGYEGGM